MKLFKKFAAIILILNSFLYVNAQAINPERGDGFWSQVSTMRMEQIIWVNDTLYASRSVMYQSNGGVYRSTDGGVNWDTLYSKSEFTSSGLRLFIHPTNHKILFLIDGALYKSTNGGQNWNYVVGASGPFVRLAINPKNPNIMYITKSIPFGTVYKTTDAGTTWNPSGTGLVNNQYFQAGPIDINSEYPDTILLGTNAGLYRSTNAGASWDTTIIKGFIPGVNFHPGLPKIAFTSTDYDWSTYKTTDFGNTWYKTIGSYGEFARNFVFHPMYSNIIYNTENLKSSDTGNTWFKLDSINNSWNDIDINSSLLPTLFASSGPYGLYSYHDFTSTLDEVINNNQIFTLYGYPNPFNNSTTIKCNLRLSANLTLQIYNILGQKIKTLVNQTELNQGEHTYIWNGQDDSNSSVASGFYLCLVFIENKEQKEVQSLKLLLLK